LEKVIITGVNSGIGLATAQKFLSMGHQVAACDLSDHAHESIISEHFFYYKCDVSDSVALRKFIEFSADNMSGLSALINNAGILGPRQKASEYTESDFEQVINVNVKPVFLGIKYALPFLLKNEYSSIVNVASVAGLMGMYGHVAYSASKHAVNGISKTIALEYATKGLRVNSVCPGFTESAMTLNQEDPRYLERMVQITPQKRLGKAAEIADLIYFLTSKEASFINGQCYAIDGGLSAQ
jgi:NAD(P)-dependent dehydrogenase (short-subunit alcohol dehydrogenase family)